MWSLNEKEVSLKPLVFSNGKTQEDVVYEVLDSIKNGDKIIFIRGGCGTGKSAIALNIAKHFKKSSIVVPIKNLQKQYEDDYSSKKHVLKDNGEKLKIKVMTGRQNHDCPFLKENKMREERLTKLSEFSNRAIITENDYEIRDFSCDNRNLPCTIEIKEKNIKKLIEYMKKNPKVKVQAIRGMKDIKRMSVAPICPYWSPIVPGDVDLNLDGAKLKYKGLGGKEFTLYRRKKGCGYYDQFESYLDADVIIFNSHKYMIETVMDRKPETDIEIIDECDEFLDNFANTETINLARLNFALASLYTENENIQQAIEKIAVFIREISHDSRISDSILNQDIIPLKETRVKELLEFFLDYALMDHVECDEENYCYHLDEIAREFRQFFDDTYVSFYKDDKDIIIKLVTVNLAQRLAELVDKNKVLVMMSGTVHSEKVLKEIFGLNKYKIIDAETKLPGKITKIRTGKEINCRYDNFQSGRVTRKQYLLALNECIKQAKRPVLVHVNSFMDLPTIREIDEFNLDIISQEKLDEIQSRGHEIVRRFKDGEIDLLYSTRCNRGVDFPGAMCNSIVLTRYPYPDVGSMFWRILKRNKPEHYNDFYVDKSRREFLQRIYRGLRSNDDHIFLLSPDIRVFENLNF